jgi:hypothetical protein
MRLISYRMAAHNEYRRWTGTASGYMTGQATWEADDDEVRVAACRGTDARGSTARVTVTNAYAVG